MNTFRVLMFICALTHQKISNFSETQLQTSQRSAFKLVYDAMKRHLKERVGAKGSQNSTVRNLPIVKQKAKKSVHQKKPKIVVRKESMDAISTPYSSDRGDPIIPLSFISTIPQTNTPLIHPKPTYIADFNPREGTFLHERNSRLVLPSSYEGVDKTSILVYETLSPFNKKKDNIATLWSQKPYIKRGVIGSISACTGKENKAFHLVESSAQSLDNSIVQIVENLYKEISPHDNDKDKEIAENIIGILKLYTAYEEDKSDHSINSTNEILKLDVINLCPKNGKNEAVKTPQKLICAIETQKEILGNLLSAYDLQVLTVTEKLLEEWLNEGGDNFFSKSQNIIQALKTEASNDMPFISPHD